MSTFPEGFDDGCKRFFDSEHTRRPGRNLYPEVFDTAMFPLQRKREMEAMIKVARATNPRVVMEIGADKAGSFYHWVKCFSTVEKAIAIEIRGVPYAHLFQKHFPAVDFLFLEGSSYAPDVVERVRQFLGDDKLDTLFIDGDKLGTSRDFLAYRPMLRPGGVVFIHDVQDDPPRVPFTHLVSDGWNTSVILDKSESVEAFQRAEAGVPCSGSYEAWLRTWKGRSCGVGVVHIPKEE